MQGIDRRLHLEQEGVVKSHCPSCQILSSRRCRLCGTFFFCLRHALQPRPEGTPGIRWLVLRGSQKSKILLGILRNLRLVGTVEALGLGAR